MMEKSTTNWYAMSDPALLDQLGHFVQQTRLRQNKTQQQIADAAGINRSTMVQVENGGGGTLLSFIQILRALGQLHLFDHFVITPSQSSPLQLAKAEQQKRQRASTPKSNTIEKPTSNW
jgi:transcriptional regulator with XRE-family HTH domain